MEDSDALTAASQIHQNGVGVRFRLSELHDFAVDRMLAHSKSDELEAQNAGEGMNLATEDCFQSALEPGKTCIRLAYYALDGRGD